MFIPVMKKRILFILLLGTSQWSVAQLTVTIDWYHGNDNNYTDTIHYDMNRKLVWTDFKGIPDQHSAAAAITESGFGYRMAMNSVNNKVNLVITVFCYFNKRKSWVKRKMDTEYALTHEQHHFDITYINTCSFIQKLKAANFTAANYARLVDSIYDECYESLRTMQDDYDGQTSNGRLKNIQASWNTKIDRMLSLL